MPICIEDIFKEIFKNYIRDYKLPYGETLRLVNHGYGGEKYQQIIKDHYNNFIKDIPTIVNFNRISKVHHKWTNEMLLLCRQIIGIKQSLIWLNPQKIILTINKKSRRVRFNDAVSQASGMTICDVDFEYAVMLNNDLHMEDIRGKYPYYSISSIWIYPVYLPYEDRYITLLHIQNLHHI